MFGIEKITEGSIKGVVGAVTDVVDRFITTSDEKNAFVVEIKKIEQEAIKTASEQVNKLEQNITDRHNADMHSDSWLSKNIRPLVLIYLMALFTLAFFMEVKEPVFNLLGDLLMSAFGFYFVIRGIEKLGNKIAHVKLK